MPAESSLTDGLWSGGIGMLKVLIDPLSFPAVLLMCKVKDVHTYSFQNVTNTFQEVKILLNESAFSSNMAKGVSLRYLTVGQ